MKYIFIIVAIILLIVSCGKAPDINEPGVCNSHGVEERGVPMGELGETHEMFDSKIIDICGPSGWVNRTHAGCAITQDDGTVDIYYRNGDNCTKIHEQCHVTQGKIHTRRYISDVAQNHPRPSCPP